MIWLILVAVLILGYYFIVNAEAGNIEKAFFFSIPCFIYVDDDAILE